MGCQSRDTHCHRQCSKIGKIPYTRFGEMPGAGIFAAIKKIMINTASSAAGTGAVLGVHGAMSPDTPQFDHAYQPTARKNSGFINVDLEGGPSFIVISVVAILVAILLGVCCRKASSCSSTKRKQKRIQELMVRSLEKMEEGKGRASDHAEKDRKGEV